MNRRGFFKGLLAAACTAVARAYVPATLAEVAKPVDAVETFDDSKTSIWLVSWGEDALYTEDPDFAAKWRARAIADAPYCNSLSKKHVDALREAFLGSET